MRIPIFFVKSREKCVCPVCNAPLKHRDYWMSIRKKDGGERQLLQVERMKCTNGGCHKLHTALQDVLVPYKHYETGMISGVIEAAIVPEDPVNEDYPCEATMLRWLYWFHKNKNRIDGFAKAACHRFLGYSEEILLSKFSLLTELQESTTQWLEALLRLIYNSGGFLVSA